MSSSERGSRRGSLRLAVAGLVVVAALGALVTLTSQPDRVTVTPAPHQRPRLALLEVSANAAYVDPPSGASRMVDASGTTLWVASGARAGNVSCLQCPVALRGADPPARIDQRGTVAPAADLAGRTAIAGVYLQPADGRLAVRVPTASGHVDVGSISAQSLDAGQYAIAPSVELAPDRRSLSAVVGLDDTREIGRVRVVLLRAGQPAVEHVVDLATPGRAPRSCRPLAAADGAWGWLTTDASGGPGVGRATLRLATGRTVGALRRLDRPYTACQVTPTGYVLSGSANSPEGTWSSVAWLDRSGRTVRSITRRGTDPRAEVSASADGVVVVPSGSGFDVVRATGAPRHLAVQDARVADTGELWTVRHGQVRREPHA